MSQTPWIGDIKVWRETPLNLKLRLLKKHYCTGPCGQSSSVLATRSALEGALNEAIKMIENGSVAVTWENSTEVLDQPS